MWNHKPNKDSETDRCSYPLWWGYETDMPTWLTAACRHLCYCRAPSHKYFSSRALVTKLTVNCGKTLWWKWLKWSNNVYILLGKVAANGNNCHYWWLVALCNTIDPACKRNIVLTFSSQPQLHFFSSSRVRWYTQPKALAHIQTKHIYNSFLSQSSTQEWKTSYNNFNIQDRKKFCQKWLCCCFHKAKELLKDRIVCDNQQVWIFLHLPKTPNKKICCFFFVCPNK